MPFVPAADLFGTKDNPFRNVKSKLDTLKCVSCNDEIHESVTGCRQLGNGQFCCSDCFYRQLGSALEPHPLASPRLSRTRR
jgi:hypothetical protein